MDNDAPSSRTASTDGLQGGSPPAKPPIKEPVNGPPVSSKPASLGPWKGHGQLRNQSPASPSQFEASSSSSTPESSNEDADAPSSPSAGTLKEEFKVAPQVPVIAQARSCNFEQFVNRFSLAESGYAIEFLEAGTELGKEVSKEVMRRHRIKVEGYQDKLSDQYKSRRLNGGLVHGTWIHAVRIQSKAVLKVLSEVGGYAWGQEPYTFMRPFAHLIHFHPKIKAKFKEIRATPPKSDEEKQEREQLQCYVSFVEERLLPPVHQFDDVQSPQARRVRYDDLWYLFKAGDLVYVPLSTLRKQWSGGDAEIPKNAVHQRVWRLEILVPHAGDLQLAMYGSSETGAKAAAWLYFIDYDGVSYKPVSFGFTIEGYDGLKEVRKLEVYPLRFEPDNQAIVQEQRELGLRFTECIQQRHVSYKAWSLLTSPLGRYYYFRGRPVTSADFIDGDVIIDFQEAFNACPHWKYIYGLDAAHSESYIETDSDVNRILLWSSPSRTRLQFSWPNIVVLGDDIEFLEGVPFRQKHAYGIAGLPKPLDEDLAILPQRLFGYALRERKFVFLHVKDVRIERSTLDTDPFRFLQIDAANKRTIRCLVSDHFNTKKARKSGEIASQDPIPGKGRSLVFLLHGPPGVGKTATVEAVAQVYRKPLFSITSGDLGSTPAQVESNLTEIFHLANVWDCVLLLDEADVFLEEREKSNLERNAVVSVFLRVMEYYSGILFLTTNRPGQLDEAVKSRVHSTLLYHSLDLRQTREIFRLNIDRLDLIERQRQANPERPARRLHCDKAGILAFAEQHWHKHEKDELGRWNGRQIRNAFIMAAALARCDDDYDDHSHDDENITAVVTQRHFEFVAHNVTNFDNYMARARGGLDSERARRRMDRPDHFDKRDGNGHPLCQSEGMLTCLETDESPRRTPRRGAALPNPSLSSSYYPTTAAPSQPPQQAPTPVYQPQMLNPNYSYARPAYNLPFMAWPPPLHHATVPPQASLPQTPLPAQTFTAGAPSSGTASDAGVAVEGTAWETQQPQVVAA